MKTKNIVLGSLALIATFFLSSANAFWGGGEGRNLTQEKFEEMKQLFTNNTFESFKTIMEAKREEMKAKHEEMQTLRETITRNVENIDNGVVITMTSDNADAVAHLQYRENEKEPRQEGVTKVTENISNGIRITITSDDEDMIEKLQTRHSDESTGLGWGKDGKEGKKGFGRGGRFGQDKNETDGATLTTDQPGQGKRGGGFWNSFRGQ
ncbi:hypothetical protein K9L27_02640 [Candidatus Gracilibacteria bacterium]|nr:hypothetical protein [Candidatus Gracilibacteria bacterium]